MKITDLFEMLVKPTPDETNAWATEVKHRLGLEDFVVWQSKDGTLKLVLLIVPKGMRKQGIGTKAMDELVQYADRHGFRLTLTTAQKDKRVGTTSKGRLLKFYKRFGFVRNFGQKRDYTISDNMYRQPHP